MSKNIITISRQCGSGGHSIGSKVAEELGIPFYDKKIMEIVAKRSGLSEDTIEKQGEENSNGVLYNLAVSLSRGYSAYSADNKHNMVLPDQIFAFQSELIRELADKESCVIVGRCADSILEGRPDCLHVYIYADLEDRKKRVIAEHGIDPEEAEYHVLSRDKKRAQHYKYYTERTWGAAKNYDICLNSSHFGVDNCVDIIVDIIKRRP